MTDPTPEELTRVKRWASMQTPEVTIGKGINEPIHYSILGWPSWAYHPFPYNWFDTDDDAWSALARALRPVFDSIVPVVIEEQRLARERESGKMQAGE